MEVPSMKQITVREGMMLFCKDVMQFHAEDFADWYAFREKWFAAPDDPPADEAPTEKKSWNQGSAKWVV